MTSEHRAAAARLREQTAVQLLATLTADERPVVEAAMAGRARRHQWQVVGLLVGALAISFANLLLGYRFGWSGEFNVGVFAGGAFAGYLASGRLHDAMRGRPAADSAEAVREHRLRLLNGTPPADGGTGVLPPPGRSP